MLQVIGAGLPRTGTTSTKDALNRLGFGPCHHMWELRAHPEQIDGWVGATLRGERDWDRLFEGYRSAVDWPSAHFWRELIDVYPEAKVILTVRDPRGWFPSIRMLMGGPRPKGGDPADLPEEVRRGMEIMRPMQDVLTAMGRPHFGPDWRRGDLLTDEDAVVAAFERHNAEVRATVPAERLLVFDVKQGWEPLCEFLGVPVPEGERFPHLNDGASVRARYAGKQPPKDVPTPSDR